jgi:hypothetical protein
VVLIHKLKTNILLQIFISVFCVFAVSFLVSNSAQALSNSSTLNFQARLLTATGAVVPDGTYNVDFKIYNTSTPSAGAVGTCTSHCLWEETYAYSGYSGGTATIGPRLTVKNGYVTVNLGAYSTFAAYALTNWSQQLYLSMNIGGTTSSGSITWDGEMGNGGPLSLGNSLLSITAVPYAFTANTLSTNNSGGLQLLQFASGSSAGTITLPDVAGYAVIAQTTPAAETGSTNITGNSTAASFLASSATDALDTTVAGALNVGTTNATSIVLNQNTSLASTLRLSVGTTGTATSQLYVSGSVPTTVMGSVSVISSPRTIFTQGNYAYITDNGALQILDISNPVSPIIVSTTGVNPYAVAIYVQGNYAYILGTPASNTLQVLNISNPTYPVIVATVALVVTNGWTIYVQGNYAYVGGDSLAIFNISNPSNPIIVDNLITGGSNRSIYVQGNYAYVVNNGNNNLQIYNISNPTSPVSLGSVATGGSPYSVYVQGNYAYVANYGSGTLQIINISNPSSPVSVYSLGGISSPQSVYVQGRYAYIFGYSSTLITIIDISSPSSPVVVGSFTGTGSADDGYVQGRYAYLVNFANSTLQVFDLGGAYIQQLQAGGAEVGTLTVDTNASVNGSESITGSLGVGTSLNVAGAGALGSLTISGIAQPTSPTVTPTGTTGSTNYSYAIQAFNSSGQSSSSTPTQTTTGNATLSATNYNAISYSAVTGATGYNIYRTASNGTPSTTGLIGSVYNTPAATPVSASETGTTLTLTFSSIPPLSVGQGVTLSGFTSTPTNINGTFPVLSVTPSTNTITVYIPSGVTSTVSVMGTATSALYFYDMASTSANGAAAPTISTAGSVNIQNASGASVLTLDVSTGRVGIDNNFNTMTVPSISAEATATTGGTLPLSTTYYYEVTAVDATGGETTPSAQVSEATGSSTSTNTITLTWAPITGAAGYHIYRTATSGVYSTDSMYASLGTVVSTNLTFTDTGSTAGVTNTSPPTTNTARVATNNSNSALQLSIGGNGTPTGQLYVSGTVPTSAVGSVATGSGSNPHSVYVQGNYAYVANHDSGTLQIIDISNPTAPIIVSSMITGTGPQSVYVQGSYAYIVDNIGLQVINIANPSSPIVVGTVTTGSNPYSVYVQGNYAYVADASGLQVFNISNPATPIVIGSVTTVTTTNPYSIYVEGNYAYVTDIGSNTLQIINISNPATPIVIGSVTTGNSPVSVYVQGSYAYVANSNSNNLQIFNISNPATPVVVSSVAGLSGSYSVFVQGRYAYVAGLSGYLYVINISNPSSPTIANSVSDASGPISVYVQGRYAYVINHYSYILQVFDLGGAYIQQLQAGGAEVGTLTVDTNASVNGSESIVGSLGVGSSLNVSGSAVLGGLTVAGIAAPGTPTETVTCSGTCATSYGYAITANNSSGSSAISPNITTSVANASLNTSTEYNETSWTAIAGISSYNVYRTVGGAAQGLIGTVGNTNVLTPTSASETGTVLTLNFSSQPLWVVGQAITLSGFTSTPTNINGTWPVLTVTSTSITINITSGATSTVSIMGTAKGILGFFDTGTTASGSAPTVTTAGIITLAATSSNAVSLAVGASTASYTLTLPTVAPTTSQCLISGAITPGLLTFGACSSNHTQTISLTPEYAGATLSNNVWNGLSDIGTMTSGFDASQYENYYLWTTSQSANQAYDVVVSVPIPNDFSSWASTTPITVDVKTSDMTNGIVNAKLYDTTKTIVTAWNTCSLTPGSTNTWTTVTGCTISGTYSNAGGKSLTLIIQLQAPTSGTTEIGNINLTYNSSF